MCIFCRLCIAALLLTASLAIVTPRASSWEPAPSTTVSCNTPTSHLINLSPEGLFDAGSPALTYLLDLACAAMMPTCAFPEFADEDLVCAAVIDYQLEHPENCTQNVSTEDVDGIGDGIWEINFSVTPSNWEDPDTLTMWRRDDCHGYFEKLIAQDRPTGCHTSEGSLSGNLTVGGTQSLKDTLFEIRFIEILGP